MHSVDAFRISETNVLFSICAFECAISNLLFPMRDFKYTIWHQPFAIPNLDLEDAFEGHISDSTFSIHDFLFGILDSGSRRRIQDSANPISKPWIGDGSAITDSAFQIRCWGYCIRNLLFAISDSRFAIGRLEDGFRIPISQTDFLLID